VVWDHILFIGRKAGWNIKDLKKGVFVILAEKTPKNKQIYAICRVSV